MEWLDYVLTVVISAIFGSLFGGLSGYFLEIWKNRKEAEKTRVNRILQPLREIRPKLLALKVAYEMSDQYNYERFYSDFQQVNRIITDILLKQGLDIDIGKESRSLLDFLTELNAKYHKAEETYYQTRSQIKSDDADSLNRLTDEYRRQLFKNERIKYLVYHLVDELGTWLRKHS